ncbi:MAG TPA: hypothetical protein DFS52_27555 [Myxococcales bacterium]|nr:hypothetical protein [Myxococcales bacterium]
MTKKNVWVTPSHEGWKVKTEGADRAAKVFERQSDAIDHARGMAQARRSELFVQGRDGRIRERDSHGQDPRNRKG